MIIEKIHSYARSLVIAFSLFHIPSVLSADLLLFSGDVFLGCMSCSNYDTNSICNSYGPYGSSYSGTSIWNQYGPYGSQYSAQSPWNMYSSQGPKIVDRSGNYYGRFSINIYDGFSNSTNLRDYYEAVDGDLDKVRDGFCQ